MNYIENNRFADQTVIVSYQIPLTKESMSEWNLLMMMLRSRTEKFNTRQALIRAAAHAYGMRMNVWKTIYGNTLTIRFGLSYIPEASLNREGYLEEVLELMDQFLNHPEFSEESFEEARTMLLNNIALNRQNPAALALENLSKIAPENSSLSISLAGDEEAAKAATLEGIKERYQDLRAYRPSIQAIGQLEKPVLDILRTIDDEDPRAEFGLLACEGFKEIEEEKAIEQSSLIQVYQTGITMGSPLFFALKVLNDMLGGGSGSLLFQSVREEHSLCYSISSELIWSQGILMVSTSASAENFEAIENLILKQIEKLAAGDFEDSLLNQSKDDLVDDELIKSDSAMSLLEMEYLDALYPGLGHPASEIEKVTREQVEEAAGTLKLVLRSAVVEKTEAKEETINDAL